MATVVDQNEMLAQTILSTIERAVDAELEVCYNSNRQSSMPYNASHAAQIFGFTCIVSKPLQLRVAYTLKIFYNYTFLTLRVWLLLNLYILQIACASVYITKGNLNELLILSTI